jgi:hypothetical protein
LKADDVSWKSEILTEEFQKAAAEGGIESALRYATELSESEWELLLGAIEEAGLGWVAIWLRLRKAAAGKSEMQGVQDFSGDK